MAIATKKERARSGSSGKYRCPACRKDDKELHEMLWDQVPSPENPAGKPRCCLDCSGVASLVMGWSAPESDSLERLSL